MASSKRDSLSSVSSVDEKKRRKRLKKLLADICSQVEFYFSDPNLRKDRFLNQEIANSTDGYVPLALIASFNKMKALTDDLGLIRKALQKSEVVQLSQDGTQIKRTKPLEEPKHNPDDCTVYVECLPLTADIAWIQKTFRYCGNVVYVSLPRYRSTGDPKGFAFVEYEKPEEAQRACQLLNNPLDDFGPPGMFPKTRKGKYVPVNPSKLVHSQSQAYRNSGQTDGMGSGEHDDIGGHKDAEKMSKAEDHSTRHHRKRHHVDDEGRDKMTFKDNQVQNLGDGSENAQDSDVFSKKEKTADAGDGGHGDKEKSDPKSHKRKRKCEKDSSEEGVKIDVKKRKTKKAEKRTEGSDGDGRDEKRETFGKESGRLGDEHPRKRKADDETTEGHYKRRKGDKNEDDLEAGDIQKDVSTTLKQIREGVKLKKVEEGQKKKRVRQRKDKEEPQLFMRVLPKAEWLKLKEQYLHLQKIGMREMKEKMRAQWRGMVTKNSAMETENIAPKDSKKPETEKKVTELEFVKGVVVRIQSQDPIESRKQLKEQLNTIAQVAYVDLEDGDKAGYIRFKNPDGAEAVVSNSAETLQGISCCLVSGEEEDKYWEKLQADRENKLNSNAKKKKDRGKKRVIARAQRALSSKTSNHMRFDDDS
ncbi:La-related protein 7 [Holothuria leucospilota]|uniref:La-related protein 7 n=1 Tax=Holothuria leucospilota TaxID=206669 RepID=A0A9Q0YHB9_HOLLE|nr:La-related protein 7 [Holothuria leucospilota]